MPSFSERLSAWVGQMGELGERWTPLAFEKQTGINRGHWHHWLHAGNRTDLPPTRLHPTTVQWATIFARMPLAFVVSFGDYRPELAVVADANRTCAWCGRGFHSRYNKRYCSIRHRGEMVMYRWQQAAGRATAAG